jgi:uncharacterized protein YoxC
MLELAVAAIAIALLAIIAAVAVFYRKIDQERREVTSIREKVDCNERSIKQISGFFLAIKGEHRAL